MRTPEEMRLKPWEKIYDLKVIEEELMRISVGPGIKKRIISGPDWLCRMIEEERKGKK